jgi:tRNA A37 methylthiotransferase MiaB
MLWKIEEVLISWEKDWEFIWRTRNFKEVRFKEIEWVSIWDLVKVKIIELDRYILKWELIK